MFAGRLLTSSDTVNIRHAITGLYLCVADVTSSAGLDVTLNTQLFVQQKKQATSAENLGFRIINPSMVSFKQQLTFRYYHIK